MTVSVLFARKNSIYKTLPGCDVFDFDRDALTCSGTFPVIAHPPCRSWGKLRHFATPRPGEKELAFFALDMVRKNGGVLEHPKGSRLFKDFDLPSPGRIDSFGGFVLGVNQSWFGHRADKATLLYIKGCMPQQVPSIPLRLEYSSHLVEFMSTSEREKTPPAFALWLYELAIKCGVSK